MATKFAVLKPHEGVYDYYDAEELAVNAFLNQAINQYIQIISGHPISIVDVNDDGSEYWYGDSLKVTPIDNGNITVEKLKDKNYKRSMILTKGIMDIINSKDKTISIPLIEIGE